MAGYDADVQIKIDADTSSAESAISNLQKAIDKAYKSPSASMRSMGVQADKLSQRIEKVTEKLREVGSQPIKSDQYAQLEDRLATLQAKADSTKERLRELSIRGFNASNSTKFAREEQALNRYGSEIIRITKQLRQMEQAGTAYTGMGYQTQEYADLVRYLSQLNQQASIMGQRMREADTSVKDLKRTLHSLLSMAAKPFKAIGKAIKEHTTRHNNDASKSFKNLLRQVLKYGLGIRSLFLLYKKLRQYGKEAFKDMATQYPEINAQLSDLSAHFSQMTHSIATAFQPLLSVVLPILNTIIDAVITAANAIGSFFAALTGQGFIYKAVKQQKNFAGAISDTGGAAKEANEELAEYDKLLVIDQNNGGGGGGGGGGGAGDTTFFEKGELNEKAVNLVEAIKDAWANGDFTELGQAFGKKIADALNSIPWDDIKKVAYKLGTSIATFLNGAITPESLGAIGKTLAEAINTAITFARGFLDKYNWNNLGKSLASGVTNFFATFDAKGLGKAIHDFIAGALDACITFFKETDFELIGKRIGEFIGSLDIPDLVSKLYELAKSIIKALAEAIKGLHSEQPILTDIGLAIMTLIAAANIVKFGKMLKTLAIQIINLLIANMPKIIKLAGIGLSIAGIYIASIDTDNTITNLLLDALGAVSLYAGLRMLNVPMGVALKIVAVKFAWDAGTEVGTSLMEFIYSQLGDTEGADYYADFTWTGFIKDITDASKTGDLKKGLKLWWKDIKDAFASGAQWFWTAFTSGWLSIINDAAVKLSRWVDTVKTAVVTGWNGIKSWAKTIWNKWVDFWEPLIELFDPKVGLAFIGEKIGKAFDWIGKELKADWENVKNFFGGLFDSAADFFEPLIELFDPKSGDLADLFSHIAEIGKNLWNGLWQGFWGVVKDIGAWIAKTFNDYIVQPIKDFFGIHSPSTVFKDIGASMMDGMLLGLKNGFEFVKKWVEGAVDWLSKNLGDKIVELTAKMVGLDADPLATANKKAEETAARNESLYAYYDLRKRARDAGVTGDFWDIIRFGMSEASTETENFGETFDNTTKNIIKNTKTASNEIIKDSKKTYKTTTKTFDGANAWSKGVADGIVKNFDSVPTEVQKQFKDAYTMSTSEFKGATTWSRQKVNDLLSGFSLMPESVKTYFLNAYEKGKLQFSTINTWASDTAKRASNGFNGMPSQIAAKFSDAYSRSTKTFSTIYDWATYRVNDVKRGFASLGSTVSAKFKEAYTNATSAFSKTSEFAGGVASNFTLGLAPVVGGTRQIFENARVEAYKETVIFRDWFNKQTFKTIAEFDIDSPSKSTVQGIWNDLASVWSNKTAYFTVEADADITDMKQKINEEIITPLNVKLGRLVAAGIVKNFNPISPILLAKGGVIPPNNRFLAMLGDQTSGTNIETPLDTMVEAFNMALENRGGAGAQTIIVELSGRQVAEVVWDETEKKYKQTGRRYN